MLRYQRDVDQIGEPGGQNLACQQPPNAPDDQTYDLKDNAHGVLYHSPHEENFAFAYGCNGLLVDSLQAAGHSANAQDLEEGDTGYPAVRIEQDNQRLGYQNQQSQQGHSDICQG